MPVDENLQKKILNANIALHKYEANYYELIHPEIYNEPEQKRLVSALKKANDLVAGNSSEVKMALDFGAGTGNVTGKLLLMGYTVTAVDISEEMCKLLEKKYTRYLQTKKLVVINSSVEDLSFSKESFDLITCYSVLHHLPDYLGAIKHLSIFLRKGGVMYLDHEISPFYWKHEPRAVANLVKFVYLYLSPVLNSLYFKIKGLNLPPLDYKLSDYWYAKSHPLNHEKIENLFENESYAFFQRIDFHLRRMRFLYPFFGLYAYLCSPETSLWIAKK